MKTAIIFLLLLALAAAAFFTRPSEADFKQYIVNQKTQGQTNLLKQGEGQLQAEWLLNNCTFNNRLFWINVQQDGKTIYTGAFSHWFNRAKVASDVDSVKHKIDSIQIQQK